MDPKTLIYKLLTSAEWAAARAQGRFEGSALDRADGFIHFSTAAQLRGTAAKYFRGEPGLVLAEVDPALIGLPLKWEPSRGGQLFAHLYGILPLSAVTRAWTLALGPEGGHAFPAELDA